MATDATDGVRNKSPHISMATAASSKRNDEIDLVEAMSDEEDITSAQPTDKPIMTVSHGTSLTYYVENVRGKQRVLKALLIELKVCTPILAATMNLGVCLLSTIRQCQNFILSTMARMMRSYLQKEYHGPPPSDVRRLMKRKYKTTSETQASRRKS